MTCTKAVHACVTNDGITCSLAIMTHKDCAINGGFFDASARLCAISSHAAMLPALCYHESRCLPASSGCPTLVCSLTVSAPNNHVLIDGVTNQRAIDVSVICWRLRTLPSMSSHPCQLHVARSRHSRDSCGPMSARHTEIKAPKWMVVCMTWWC